MWLSDKNWNLKAYLRKQGEILMDYIIFTSNAAMQNQSTFYLRPLQTAWSNGCIDAGAT